jgi:hypothetical protein
MHFTSTVLLLGAPIFFAHASDSSRHISHKTTTSRLEWLRMPINEHLGKRAHDRHHRVSAQRTSGSGLLRHRIIFKARQ